MDNQVIKEEMQFRPIELQFKSAIRNQKGARKTMPSVRQKHSEPGLMKSRLTNMPSEINTEPKRVSAVLNIDFSPVASTSNSTSFTTSENNFETSKTRTLDSINSDKEIEKENSLELTHEKKSNGTLSSQTKRNSLESERKICGKRPIESGDFSNIYSQEILVKESLLPENYEREARGDADSNVSIGKRKINNYTYAETKYPNETINHTKSVFLPLQSRKNVNNKNVKNSSGSKPLPKFWNFGRTSKREVKIVRFLDKENKNPRQAFKTQLQDVNITRRHFPAKQMSRILINQNVKGSSSHTPASQNIFEEKKQGNTLQSHLMKNNLPVTDVRHMNGIRPVCYQLPPTFKTFKNTAMFPKYSFQAHAPHKGMIGTATRDPEQNMSNLRVIFPQQLRMQYNLADNIAAADNINAAHPPFSVSRVEAGTEETKTSLRISNDFCHVTTAENNRKQTKSENQACPESSLANPEGGRESQIFTSSADAKNLNPQMSADKTGVLDKSSKDRQANNCEAESDVEDRIQATKMTLTKISELLQNINKELLCGFECRGLELSLPIWRTELEQCILSVEKIKSVISEYQGQKK